MEKVYVDLGRQGYWIHIGSGILGGIGPALKPFQLSRRLALITHPSLLRLYGPAVEESLRSEGHAPIAIPVPEGERSKSLEAALPIYDVLVSRHLDRKTAVLALGGGVVGDLAGFIAATYLRGVSFIQIPTTLLAQVDSSVGGKVGVDHPMGKNLIGAFYQPRMVWTDVETLASLPREELVSGLAEAIKTGVIADRAFFSFIEENVPRILGLDREALISVIARSCRIKADVVEKDEREQGLRAILNYGHTVGHAVEAAAGYSRYRHGEAVSIGMACAARIAHRLGYLREGDVERQERLIREVGLPTTFKDLPVKEIMDRLRLDKKVLRGRVRFVLPKSIGEVFITDQVPTDLVEDVLEEHAEASAEGRMKK